MRRLSNLQWLFILAICALIILIIGAITLYIEINRLEIEPKHLVESAPFWMFWAIHAPLIFLLSRRFSFERRRLAKRLLFYIMTGTIWAMLVQGLPVFLLLLLKDFTNYQVAEFHLLGNWAVMFLPNMLIFWLVFSISLISSYNEQYQKELLKASTLDAQLSNARLQALKMQLHPHFLFNTLHSISALVLKQENRDAVKMINRLSELLRLALDNIETQVVSLRDEIEFTRRYLEIEIIRFKDRLAVDWELNPLALDAQVPNLILQPLVENAMRHAIDSKSGPSRIQIIVHLQDNKISMEVRDDGNDLEKISVQNGGAGLGLKNIRARLSELYGEDYSFTLSKKSKDEWTIARIIIPFLPVKERTTGELN